MFGFQIELQPKILDDNEIELTMEATLTEPMRAPNTARAGEALSIAKQTLRLKPGQSAIVPGDAFDRYVKSPGDRFIQEEVFRMMPLYVVTARAVTSMPQQSPGPAPATTAAEATTRK